MKFVADVHVTRRMVNRLRLAQHEVIWLAEGSRRLSDRSILRFALDQQALVITLDKDYRYHTLEEKQPSLGVVWIRRISRKFDQEAETERVMQVIDEYGERLWQHLTIIYPDRVEQHPPLIQPHAEWLLAQPVTVL
ncbi:MAG TPA: DUF5615 family PIN-like protein [Ktedonobacterales bacterium]|nr:DUF5615 family PIN-like protein [Ktedonobacterales bacterium]